MAPNLLITIPVSHYCERARWALDHAGVPYREERHLQMFHLRAVRKAGGERTVPVLVTERGALTESRDIVAFADAEAPAERKLYPADEAERAEVRRWEERLETHFGAETRRVAYHALLPHRTLLLKYNNRGAPAYQGWLLRLIYPLACGKLRKHFDVRDETAAEGEAHVRRVLDDVGRWLGDGRPYLMGAHLTAADITFAALLGPLIFPDGYATGLPSLEELPADARAMAEDLRAHPASQHALRMYAERR